MAEPNPVYPSTLQKLLIDAAVDKTLNVRPHGVLLIGRLFGVPVYVGSGGLLLAGLAKAADVTSAVHRAALHHEPRHVADPAPSPTAAGASG